MVPGWGTAKDTRGMELPACSAPGFGHPSGTLDTGMEKKPQRGECWSAWSWAWGRDGKDMLPLVSPWPPLPQGHPGGPRGVPTATLAGDGEGADWEALLVPLHPGPARLGADLLAALHLEAVQREARGLAGTHYGAAGLSFGGARRYLMPYPTPGQRRSRSGHRKERSSNAFIPRCRPRGRGYSHHRLVWALGAGGVAGDDVVPLDSSRLEAEAALAGHGRGSWRDSESSAQPGGPQLPSNPPA